MTDAKTKAKEEILIWIVNQGSKNEPTFYAYVDSGLDKMWDAALKEDKRRIMTIREIRSELITWCRKSGQLEPLTPDQIQEIERIVFSFISVLQIFPKNYELGFLRGKQSHNDECSRGEKP